MDTSTVNQLIESFSFIAIAGLSGVFYWKATRIRRDLNREARLLRDCLYFRKIIDIYVNVVKEEEDAPGYLDVRAQAQEALGYAPSTYSQPFHIRKRLEALVEIDHSIEEFLSKIPE